MGKLTMPKFCRDEIFEWSFTILSNNTKFFEIEFYQVKTKKCVWEYLLKKSGFPVRKIFFRALNTHAKMNPHSIVLMGEGWCTVRPAGS